MADHSTRIAQIREILASGVTEDTVDGQTVKYDHRSLRQELRDLMAEDDFYRSKRPTTFRVDLGGFR